MACFVIYYITFNPVAFTRSFSRENPAIADNEFGNESLSMDVERVNPT